MKKEIGMSMNGSFKKFSAIFYLSLVLLFKLSSVRAQEFLNAKDSALLYRNGMEIFWGNKNLSVTDFLLMPDGTFWVLDLKGTKLHHVKENGIVRKTYRFPQKEEQTNFYVMGHYRYIRGGDYPGTYKIYLQNKILHFHKKRNGKWKVYKTKTKKSHNPFGLKNAVNQFSFRRKGRTFLCAVHQSHPQKMLISVSEIKDGKAYHLREIHEDSMTVDKELYMGYAKAAALHGTDSLLCIADLTSFRWHIMNLNTNKWRTAPMGEGATKYSNFWYDPKTGKNYLFTDDLREGKTTIYNIKLGNDGIPVFEKSLTIDGIRKPRQIIGGYAYYAVTMNKKDLNFTSNPLSAQNKAANRNRHFYIFRKKLP
jgi:hypothetical protein